LINLKYNGNNEVVIIQNNNVIFQITSNHIDDSICEAIKYALNSNFLILKFSCFPKQITKILDICYGKSFENKFKYATLNIEKFIQFMIEKFYNEKQTIKKLVSLLSPIQKIEHDQSLSIKLNPPYIITQYMKIGANILKSDKFIKPDVSFFTDASVSSKTYLAGYGVSGHNVVASFRKKDSTNDNNIAELKAISMAIYLAKDMNVSSLEIFTDSDPSIMLLKKYKINPQNVKNEFKNILEEISNNLELFEFYQIAWIPRQKNKFADYMSKENFPTNFLNLV